MGGYLCCRTDIYRTGNALLSGERDVLADSIDTISWIDQKEYLDAGVDRCASSRIFVASADVFQQCVDKTSSGEKP